MYSTDELQFFVGLFIVETVYQKSIDCGSIHRRVDSLQGRVFAYRLIAEPFQLKT
jgi:hypothetical protein